MQSVCPRAAARKRYVPKTTNARNRDPDGLKRVQRSAGGYVKRRSAGGSQIRPPQPKSVDWRIVGWIGDHASGSRVDTPHGQAEPICIPPRAAGGADPRSRRRWRGERAGPRGGGQRRPSGRRQRRARRAALPRRRAALARAGRQLDAAWIAVVEQLAPASSRGLPLVAAGARSGARVACRTAAATGAVGVLCLAFPLQPPRRRARRREPPARARRRHGARPLSCRASGTRSACRRPVRVAKSSGGRQPRPQGRPAEADRYRREMAGEAGARQPQSSAASESLGFKRRGPG